MIELIIHTYTQPYANILSGSYPFPIEEIARVLSRIRRYACHHQSVNGLSVARHSLHTLEIVQAKGGTPLECLAALMHDAAEAYIGDVTAPVKRFVPEIVELEEEIRCLLFRQHGIPIILPDIVWEADKSLTAGEITDIFPNHFPGQYASARYSEHETVDYAEFLLAYNMLQARSNG